MCGTREGGSDLLAVAVVKIEADVPGSVSVQQRRIRRRGGACGRHRRQRIDINENQLGRVLRLLDRLRHHHGDRLADIADPIGRERSLRRTRCRRAIAMLARGGRHVLDASRVQIRCRDDHVHAGHLTRSVSIDRAQFAMRHPAAYHDAVELAGAVQIVGIAAFAAQQHRVFLPRDRLADGKFLVHQQRGVERRIHQGLLS